jgi:hypothetical protein
MTRESDMRLFVNGIQKLVPAAALMMSALVPIAGHASTLIGLYDTGRHFDSGGCFGKWFNRGIGAGYRAANVQLAGHDMYYESSDHHIRRSKMRISHVGYNRSTGNVSFYVSGCFHDKNPTDNIYWRAFYTIVADNY